MTLVIGPAITQFFNKMSDTQFSLLATCGKIEAPQKTANHGKTHSPPEFQYRPGGPVKVLAPISSKEAARQVDFNSWQ
jgi:hypothetical protein